MTRWYAYATCRGNAAELTSRLAKVIQANALSSVIPRICYERPQFRNRSSEFYLFVALESEAAGSLPPGNVENVLQSCGIRLVRDYSGALACVTRKDITTMVGSDVHTEEMARQLRIPPAPQPLLDDPFEPYDTSSEDHPGGAGSSLFERSAAFERLMLWISHAGDGSFGQLRSACQALGIDTPMEGTTRQVVRRLRLLGHLETSADGSRWAVAPPVLVASEPDQGNYILCGARDSKLLDQLHQYGNIETEPQVHADGPPRVRILGLEPGRAEVIAGEIAIAGDAALTIAKALPPVQRWTTLLQSINIPEDSLKSLDISRLIGPTFQRCAFKGETGLYQIEQSGTGRRQWWYFDAAIGKWKRGDWYGLQFLARLKEFGRLRCEYDSEQQILGVPIQYRWPEVYERPLVLTSGLLPELRNGWLLYDSVEPELLEPMSGLLSLDVNSAGE